MSSFRILVTGAQGIIGRHSVKYIRNLGHEVHEVSRHAVEQESPRFRFAHQGDLLDPEFSGALIKQIRPTHLLHLAWTTEHGKFWEDPANRDWYDASIRLIRAFSDAGGRRLVVAGTCAEYDWQSAALRTGKCLEFDSELGGQSLYGQTKNKLRSVIKTEFDISFAWGRVFFPYGPGENVNRLIPHVISSLLQRKTVAMGPGTDIRDFIATADAGAAFAKLLLSEVQGAVNIASGEGYAISEIAEKIARKLGHVEMLKFGARPARPDDPPYLVGDNQRLVREVGYSDFTNIDQGLDIAIEWWRTHLAR